MTIQIIYNEYSLSYDSQTGVFTVGNVVYGETSGAYATIRRIDRIGSTTGTLYLQDITGTFQDNEVIYEATYEDELLINGTFATDSDWNKTANVTIAGDEAIFTAAAQYEYISTHYEQDDPCTAGYFYKMTFDVTNHSSGCIILFDKTVGAGDGSYSYHMQATSAYVDYYAGLDGVNTFHIDNVSCKKITNAALANGIVQSPITIDLELTLPGINKNFMHESSVDRSYSGKVQIINQYGIQEMSFGSMFSMATYYKLLAWWSWARQGKLWAFTMDSTKTGNTTLDGGAASGQKVIPVTSTTAFLATDVCLLKKEDSDDAYEVIVIASVSAGVSVTAVDNLKFNYTASDSLKHLDYWPEVVTLNKFAPTRTGAVNTTDKYWRNTFKFTEAL